MAQFDLIDPNTNETVRIEAEREPTQVEALDFFNSERAGQFRGEERFTPVQQAALTVGGGPLGGLAALAFRGRPVTQTEAAAEGALEELARLPGQTAQGLLTAPPPLRLASLVAQSLGLGARPAPQEPSLTARLTGLEPEQGLLERFSQEITAPVLQAPERIEEALGVERGPERAIFREPEAAAAGEFLTQAGPAIAGAAPILGRATQAVGRGLAAVTPRFVAKPFQRGLTTPVIEKATGLIPDVSAEKLPEVLTQASPRIIEAAGGKLAKTGKEFIEAAKKAETVSINEAKDFLKQAEEGGFVMKGDFMQQRGRAEVLKVYDSLTDQPEVLDEILSRPVFQKLTGEVSPTQGQKSLRELNTEYERFLDKRSPEAIAYRAIRDELADQLDDIVKLSSGKNIQPYRDFGNIREFRSGVENRLEAARQAAGREAVPVTSQLQPGVSTAFGGRLGAAAARRVARMSRTLIKQGQEFVDDAVESVLKASPKKLRRVDLSEDAIAELRQNYLRKAPVIGETPPPLPPTAPIVPAAPVVPTLEELIQETIQSLPREMRGRNERAIAEAILRQSQAP